MKMSSSESSSNNVDSEAIDLHSTTQVEEQGPEEKQEEQEENSQPTASEDHETPEKIEKMEQVEEDNDGFRTPTSIIHRIPPMLECPPAPKKRPSLSPVTMKKKKKKQVNCDAVDISCVELFFQQYLRDTSYKIKKTKKGSDGI